MSEDFATFLARCKRRQRWIDVFAAVCTIGAVAGLFVLIRAFGGH